MEAGKFLVGYNRSDAMNRGMLFDESRKVKDYARKHDGGSIWVSILIDDYLVLKYVDFVNLSEKQVGK